MNPAWQPLNNMKNVLIISTFGLGDTLLSTPLPRALEKWRTDIQVDYLVLRGARPLLEANPHIRNVYPLDLGARGPGREFQGLA